MLCAQLLPDLHLWLRTREIKLCPLGGRRPACCPRKGSKLWYWGCVIPAFVHLLCAWFVEVWASRCIQVRTQGTSETCALVPDLQLERWRRLCGIRIEITICHGRCRKISLSGSWGAVCSLHPSCCDAATNPGVSPVEVPASSVARWIFHGDSLTSDIMNDLIWAR